MWSCAARAALRGGAREPFGLTSQPPATFEPEARSLEAFGLQSARLRETRCARGRVRSAPLRAAAPKGALALRALELRSAPLAAGPPLLRRGQRATRALLALRCGEWCSLQAEPGYEHNRLDKPLRRLALALRSASGTRRSLRSLCDGAARRNEHD